MTAALSVVVINHDYEEFVGQAVDSALAQTVPVQVVVVDDGSQDGSWPVIEAYGDRVLALQKANGGMSSAANLALGHCVGQVVLFLDADDLMHPDAARQVLTAWRPECCKVQYRLSLIDAAGNRTGVDPPLTVAMPQGDVLPEVLRSGRYTTPVTSGNAYSRRMLEALFPIPEQDFRNIVDGYLNPLCPFYGPVVSLDAELGSYRMHGRNIWAYSGEVTVEGMRNRVRHDLVRERYLVATAGSAGLVMAPDTAVLDPLHVLQRLTSRRLDPSRHPVAGDSVLRLTRRGMTAALRTRDLDLPQRLALATALPLVAVLPRPRAMAGTSWLLASRPRPAWLRAAARVLRRRFA